MYNSKDFKNLQWLGTDIITQNNVTATNNLNQYTVNYDSNEGSVKNVWNILYSSLKNANAAIGRAGKVQNMDEALKSQRVAEAKFLRALYYFTLFVIGVMLL